MIPKLIQRRGAQHLAEEEAADLLSRDDAPALTAPPAIVETMRIAAKRSRDDVVVLCFSGRGDKDCAEVARLMGEKQ